MIYQFSILKYRDTLGKSIVNIKNRYITTVITNIKMHTVHWFYGSNRRQGWPFLDAGFFESEDLGTIACKK